MKDQTTRDCIVEAADSLFYRLGFERTSFSDIASEVGISRGNFYYHFRTKDEILDAVIRLRLENTRKMLQDWESDDPHLCILGFIRILTANREKIMLYGCPVGTLCMELSKLGHASMADAGELFLLFRSWLGAQFVRLGLDDADSLAMHLLARSQGVATLASAFREEKFIEDEIKLMEDWLDACIAAVKTAQ